MSNTLRGENKVHPTEETPYSAENGNAGKQNGNIDDEKDDKDKKKGGFIQFLKTNWKLVAIIVGIAAAIFILSIIIAVVVATSGDTVSLKTSYDYSEVIHKSILFYEAQRSGVLPETNRIPYRGDSALDDKGVNGEDLTGGWYDAGDHIKSTFPMAFSVAVLTWGYLEFKDAYEEAGETQNMLDCIRWGTDFLLKAHTAPNELYVQIAKKSVDHGYWGRPEEMTMNRTSFKVTTETPGSDVAGEVSAALAAASIIFADSDPDYANQLLDESKELFHFADNYRGFYKDSFPDISEAIYISGSKYEDEIAWAAIWLYKATGEEVYLNKSENEIPNMIGGRSWAFGWSQVDAGVHTLLYNLTGNSYYKKRVTRYVDEWLPGNAMPYTPKGLAFRNYWGSLRYASSTAFIALVAAESRVRRTPYRQFAKDQLHYILGDTGRSYVCGFGENPPVQPHHRSSSCPDLPEKCAWNSFGSPDPNPQILYGALVGGPDENDDYEDARADYYKNEVTLDYNAGMQSAVAGLLHLALTDQMP
ncbi:endoglucanase E-4-like [Saccoglossus kowalevskii]